MKKVLAILLSMLVIVSVFALGTVFASSKYDTVPAIRVRVNGNWFAADITSFKGQDAVWVSCPIDITKLNGAAENYFSVSSNVKNLGNFDATSVDLYATNSTDGRGSMLCTDQYCDGSFSGYSDRYLNFKLELFDGTNWVSVPTGETYSTDQHTVLGYFSANTSWYNAARNLTLPAITSYSKARVSVQLHVGTNLTLNDGYTAESFGTFLEVEESSSSSSEVSSGVSSGNESSSGSQSSSSSPSQAAASGKTLAAVRVRVNGSWYAVNLSPYLGKDDAWVYCNIELEKLKADEENYFSIGSNVKNIGNMSAQSIDLFATGATENLTSFLCSDQYCDNGFTGYGDRNINMRLELFDGSNWIAVPSGETYQQDFTTVLGLFDGDQNWYHAARNLTLGSLSGYTKARIALQMHVGTDLAIVEGYSEETFGTFLETGVTGDSFALILISCAAMTLLLSLLLLRKRKTVQ